jgi:hypothetical protein
VNDYPEEVCTLLRLVKSKGRAGLNVDDIKPELETAQRISESKNLVCRRPVNNESLDEIGRDDGSDYKEDEWTPSAERLFLTPDGELALLKDRSRP